MYLSCSRTSLTGFIGDYFSSLQEKQLEEKEEGSFVFVNTRDKGTNLTLQESRHILLLVLELLLVPFPSVSHSSILTKVSLISCASRKHRVVSFLLHQAVCFLPTRKDKKIGDVLQHHMPKTQAVQTNQTSLFY